MRLRRPALALLLFAALAGISSATAALADRDALWLTVQSCKAASRALGLAFPCLQVREAPEGPGYVVLRAPLERTHLVVSPTRRIAGLESPDLRTPEAGDYWRAAWAARRFVAQSRERPVGVDDIGLAVNSAQIRSQDQFHIHADCVDRHVRQTLAAQGGAIGASWRLLPVALAGERYFARRLEERQLGRFNPLTNLLDSVAATRDRMRATGFAILPAPPLGREPSVYLLASASGRGGAEELLDHACRAL